MKKHCCPKTKKSRAKSRERIFGEAILTQDPIRIVITTATEKIISFIFAIPLDICSLAMLAFCLYETATVRSFSPSSKSFSSHFHPFKNLLFP